MNLELARMFLKRHFSVALIVGLLVGVLAGGLGAMFPEMAAVDARSVAETWPPLMRHLFGDPFAGFTNIYAWLNLQVFHITLWTALGVLASILASRIVAWEAEKKTLDVLLSIPLSRAAILISRLLALILLTSMAALPIAAACGLAVAIRGVPLNIGAIVLATMEGVLLSLVLAAMALLISILIPRQTPAIAGAMGAAGMLFITNEVLIHVMPWLDYVSFLNPFHWYSAGDILIRGVFSPWPLLALSAMTMIYAVISILLFTIRDAPA
jgi:ABC-2 type transport system permease protein